MSEENPHTCPRCGTLIPELPATCQVCGARLKSPERAASGRVRGNRLELISALICMMGWGGYLLFPGGLVKLVAAVAVMSGPISWIILADRRGNAVVFVISLMLAAMFALGLLILGAVQSVGLVGR